VDTATLLKELPGCTRNWLYYLEFRGVIRPMKDTRRHYQRRSYSPADVEVVRQLWHLYQQGFRLSAAVDIISAQQDKAPEHRQVISFKPRSS